MLVFDQYSIANVCFIITAGFIFAKIVHIAVTSNESLGNRVLFTFLLFGIFGVGIVELVRAVNHYQQQKASPLQSEPKEKPVIPAGQPTQPLQPLEESSTNQS